MKRSNRTPGSTNRAGAQQGVVSQTAPGRHNAASRRYANVRPAVHAKPADDMRLIDRIAAIDMPPQRVESRATIDAHANTGGLNKRQLRKATRNNPRYARRYNYTPADFGTTASVDSVAFAICVANYQARHGLVADGMAGKNTSASIAKQRAAKKGNANAGRGTGRLETGILGEGETPKPPRIGDGQLRPAFLEKDRQLEPGLLGEDEQLEPGLLGEDGQLEPGLLGEDGQLEPGLLGEDEQLEPGLLGEDEQLEPGLLGEDGQLEPGLLGEDEQLEPGLLGVGNVQFKGAPVTNPSDVQAIAAQGLQGSAQPLPHLDTIQASFGAHDVTNVEAHIGGPATQAAGTLGAQAYASGNCVAFGFAPDLHTAAHEAAHVVQQRAGVSLKGGVGQAGDSYEQHADAVADLVVQGKSAEGLLGETTEARGLHSGAVQHKPATGSRQVARSDRDGAATSARFGVLVANMATMSRTVFNRRRSGVEAIAQSATQERIDRIFSTLDAAPHREWWTSLLTSAASLAISNATAVVASLIARAVAASQPKGSTSATAVAAAVGASVRTAATAGLDAIAAPIAKKMQATRVDGTPAGAKQESAVLVSFFTAQRVALDDMEARQERAINKAALAHATSIMKLPKKAQADVFRFLESISTIFWKSRDAAQLQQEIQTATQWTSAVAQARLEANGKTMGDLAIKPTPRNVSKVGGDRARHKGPPPRLSDQTPGVVDIRLQEVRAPEHFRIINATVTHMADIVADRLEYANLTEQNVPMRAWINVGDGHPLTLTRDASGHIAISQDGYRFGQEFLARIVNGTTPLPRDSAALHTLAQQGAKRAFDRIGRSNFKIIAIR